MSNKTGGRAFPCDSIVERDEVGHLHGFEVSSGGMTGQEISLGRIDRKDAVAQAIEANNYIDQNYLPSSLLDRIKDVPTFTVAAWLERYEVILERRELKPNTMKVRRNQIATIKEEFGKIPSLLSRQRTSPHSLKRTFSAIKRAWLPGSGLC
jgi:hypothetical protein